jgi:transmembrane 9 superfamily protein 3
LVPGIVGEMDDKGDNLYIWTHKKFEIGYNGKQVTIYSTKGP